MAVKELVGAGMSIFIVVYLVAVALAMLGTPQVIRLARAAKIVDQPGLRKVHSRPIPRLGGVLVFLATIGGGLAAFLDSALTSVISLHRTQLLVLVAAASVMFITGLIDDIRGLRARLKLALHLLAAFALCASGVRMETLAVGDSIVSLGWVSWPLTILWIAGITNAVNLIDGLDGLAAGIAAIACCVIAFVAGSLGQWHVTVLMLALLGSLCGFLFFNSRPAKIFLGDSGTYFIGFMLAASTMMACGPSSHCIGLAVVLLVLGVPVMDMFFSVLRRLLQRRSIFAPDRGHIHHQLLEAGMPHGHVVLSIYVVTLAVAALAICMTNVSHANALTIFSLGWLLLLGVFIRVGAVRLRESIEIFKRNMTIAASAKRYQLAFEEAQLRLREAVDLEGWWLAACLAGHALGLGSLTLHMTGRDGDARALTWNRAEEPEDVTGMMHMSVPIQDRRAEGTAWIEMDIYVNGSLELAGRRAALFDRLMEEQSLAALPKVANTGRKAEYVRSAASKIRSVFRSGRKASRAEIS